MLCSDWIFKWGVERKYNVYHLYQTHVNKWVADRDYFFKMLWLKVAHWATFFKLPRILYNNVAHFLNILSHFLSHFLKHTKHKKYYILWHVMSWNIKHKTYYILYIILYMADSPSHLQSLSTITTDLHKTFKGNTILWLKSVAQSGSLSHFFQTPQNFI